MQRLRKDRRHTRIRLLVAELTSRRFLPKVPTKRCYDVRCEIKKPMGPMMKVTDDLVAARDTVPAVLVPAFDLALYAMVDEQWDYVAEAIRASDQRRAQRAQHDPNERVA